uniref:Uncharacterized protein n=1 Tax=Tetraselmis sp. GSL018 TaxID=582737 RepID=A0A061QVN5_9CHLO
MGALSSKKASEAGDEYTDIATVVPVGEQTRSGAGSPSSRAGPAAELKALSLAKSSAGSDAEVLRRPLESGEWSDLLEAISMNSSLTRSKSWRPSSRWSSGRPAAGRPFPPPTAVWKSKSMLSTLKQQRQLQTLQGSSRRLGGTLPVPKPSCSCRAKSRSSRGGSKAP